MPQIRNLLRLFARKLPPAIRGPLQKQFLKTEQRLAACFRKNTSTRDRQESTDYAARLASEFSTFENQVNVHDLPDIFHYWSNRYVRPVFESFGFSHPDAFFEQQLAAAYDGSARSATAPARFISIGAGNCDTEVRLAAALVASGRPHFIMECMDINSTMLERGMALAAEATVARQIQPCERDFNKWIPDHNYAAVLANQALHHVVNLEGLFDGIYQAIGDDGRFITSDMIGRNGHARWPEALAIVQEFWRELPQEYRYNQQLQRHEETLDNWDCSTSGFEGIRAQDILPLLIDRFGFDFFVAFGAIIDPFVDRAFGHNFDADAEWDRGFIDRVHSRDNAEILSGRVKPTHMLAVMVADRASKPKIWRHLTPAFCVRPPAAV